MAALLLNCKIWQDKTTQAFYFLHLHSKVHQNFSMQLYTKTNKDLHR